MKMMSRAAVPFAVLLASCLFRPCSAAEPVHPAAKKVWKDDGIRISHEFEGGCLDHAVKCGPNFYSLVLRPDTWYYFHFNITGCKGKKIVFHFITRDIDNPAYDKGAGRWIVGEHKHFPQISYDHKTWTDVDQFGRQPGGARGSFLFTQTFKEDTAWIGYNQPYLYTDLRNYLENLCRSPLITRSDIGLSRGGVKQDRLTITRNPDSRKTVLLISREDADEMTTSYAAEGMLNWLVSDDPLAVRFLNEYVVEFIPMVCVDGVIAGATHSAGYGYGGAQWAEEPSPDEIQNVKDLTRKLVKSGQTIVLAAKIHGGQFMGKGGMDFIASNERLHAALLKYKTEYWNPSKASKTTIRPQGYFERFMVDEFDLGDVFGMHVQGESEDDLRFCGRDVLIAAVKYLDDKQNSK